jgi:hypothetical protein
LYTFRIVVTRTGANQSNLLEILTAIVSETARHVKKYAKHKIFFLVGESGMFEKLHFSVNITNPQG